MTGSIAGFFAPWVACAWITVLTLVLPGRWVDGYARDPATGLPYRYRLNGLLVLIATVVSWVALCWNGLLPWDFLYVHRWEGLAGACTLGLLFTGAVVFTAPPTGQGLVADVYLGRRPEPRWGGGRLDAKMWLYVFGAVMLALNLLSFTAWHVVQHAGHVNVGVLLHVVLFGWFLVEYLVFERVHLYTWDLVAERVGFKLGWGCLTFYPYFYGVGLWAVADLPDPGQPAWLRTVAAVLFFFGWTLARGANLQKHLFKTRPDAAFLGIFEPVTISDGERSILASGWWGVSRHVNYLGEIAMACGLTLALGWPANPIPWLYPLYYVALLVPRQIADDARCKEKYGPLWDAYCARVRWRIVPFVY